MTFFPARFGAQRRGCCSAVILLLLAIVAPVADTGAQVDFTIEPAMTKGAPDAPVTIVEFSDYQ